MEMTQGGGQPRPMNFTANDYCTGIHLAAGCGARAARTRRGAGVTSAEGSLMMTATVFQSEHVAQLACHRSNAATKSVPICWGPRPGVVSTRPADGWIVVCAAKPEQLAALRVALGLDEISAAAIAAAVGAMTKDAALACLGAHHVPAAISVHPSAVPDDEQVRGCNLLAAVGHPVAGRFVQVGIPLRLSVDTPTVKGPAPAPARFRRRVRSRA